MAEIKLVSAVTLRDVLGPFDVVDYLELDIQQSEIMVFPPFLDLLQAQVRRVHIGTHGNDVHRLAAQLFRRRTGRSCSATNPTPRTRARSGRSRPMTAC